MKKVLFFLTVTFFSLSFTACDNDDDPAPTPPGDTKEGYINANSSTVWQYYSFAKNDTVGSAEGNEVNDAAWATRKDWDIAIRRYNIRTNSGTSTSVGALGGVYAFDTTNKDDFGNINVKTLFTSIQNVTDTIAITPDAIVTYAGMSGDITTSQSKAIAVQMKKNADGSMMPPVYLKAPVCIFRTADGNTYYKVEFTQYLDDASKPGHVKFNIAPIYK